MALFLVSCREDISSRYPFERAILVEDSVSLLLRMNEPVTIKTTEGEMSIYFIADELCSQDLCSTCDVNASVKIFLVSTTDTAKVEPIRIYRCGQVPPILYRTVDCSQQQFGYSGYHFAKYGRIIYNIKEMYPYPATQTELAGMISYNLYHVKLIALNDCEK